MKTCKYCGKTVGDTDRYCIHCGKPLGTEQTEYEYKEKETFGEESPQGRETEERDSKPLRTAQYLGMLIVLAIPVVNLIFGLIWAFRRRENENRRNLSRAWLILAVIETALAALLAVVLISADVVYSRPFEHHEYYEYYDGEDDMDDFFDTDEEDWEELEREIIEDPEKYEKYYQYIMENPDLNIKLPEPGDYPLDPKELLPEGMGEI